MTKNNINNTIHNNLNNNMISSLTTIINDELNNNVDIQTIIANAKTDKRFYRLLSLCIKYDIHIFNQTNETCTLFSIESLLLQCSVIQKKLCSEFGTSLLSIDNPENTWQIEIDNIYSEYKKKFKEFEVLIYILKNIFDDKSLQQLCFKNNISSSENSSDNKVKPVKKINNKYIAVYETNK
jgi:hypothetical protein